MGAFVLPIIKLIVSYYAEESGYTFFVNFYPIQS